jgi:accessory gene regulator protein AgrB
MMLLTVVEAWWSEPQSDRIGAFVIGGLGLYAMTLYMTLGFLVRRGIGRTYVILSSLLMTLMSILSCILGLIVLLLTEQPWHVWAPFLITGVIGVFIFGPMPLFAIVIYRHFERRQLDASILRSGPTNTLMTSENTP